jgi:hypothetical protein
VRPWLGRTYVPPIRITGCSFGMYVLYAIYSCCSRLAIRKVTDGKHAQKFVVRRDTLDTKVVQDCKYYALLNIAIITGRKRLSWPHHDPAPSAASHNSLHSLRFCGFPARALALASKTSPWPDCQTSLKKGREGSGLWIHATGWHAY